LKVPAGYVLRRYRIKDAEALTDASFKLPDLETVLINHDRANHKSRAIPQRLGFTKAKRTKPETWQWEMGRSAWLAREETAAAEPAG